MQRCSPLEEPPLSALTQCTQSTAARGTLAIGLHCSSVWRVIGGERAPRRATEISEHNIFRGGNVHLRAGAPAVKWLLAYSFLGDEHDAAARQSCCTATCCCTRYTPSTRSCTRSSSRTLTGIWSLPCCSSASSVFQVSRACPCAGRRRTRLGAARGRWSSRCSARRRGSPAAPAPPSWRTPVSSSRSSASGSRAARSCC